ncbi:ABC transporter ATP-binding protein [Agrococcus baldri]|uniref:Ferric enterobactin transporter FepC n=1 Tax=Agrococcus baldri TaxID=153730 RepID=A0AA87UW24_9MICO|nr:ABC transporter ATP-binding protein [Agrococcus baldri]GEK79067.1 ferric enterobactin transporter FepC [Agrococcus baldri]
MSAHQQTAPSTTGLVARGLTLAYGDATIASGLDLTIRTGELTAVIGPNGCGKSTLLRALGGALRPAAGVVELDGRDLRSHGGRELGRRIALLPQEPVAPDMITVRDLVARARHPHHTLLRQWLPGDAAIVDAALEATGVAGDADRRVAELSGGQRQRVWLALVIAQQTDHVLLDEPTSFLDIAHQIELLHLAQDLRSEGRTVVAVLHDLNQAARYADWLVVMHGGRIAAQGRPAEVVTEALAAEVFGLDAEIVADPQSGTPMVVPRQRAAT